MSGQGLNIECTVRKHCSTAKQSLVFGTIRIHMHDDTREVVRKIRIFPSGIHYTSVVHDYWIPVRILIEGKSAQSFILRCVQNHITYRIGSAYTWNSLITDI